MFELEGTLRSGAANPGATQGSRAISRGGGGFSFFFFIDDERQKEIGIKERNERVGPKIKMEEASQKKEKKKGNTESQSKKKEDKEKTEEAEVVAFFYTILPVRSITSADKRLYDPRAAVIWKFI